MENIKKKWMTWIRSDKAIFTLMTLTKYHVPEAETFQLLGGNDEEPKSDLKVSRDPVVHLRSIIKVSVMAEDVDIPSTKGIPGEIYHLLRLHTDGKRYLPMV